MNKITTQTAVMTIKEISDILNVSPRVVQMAVKDLYPDIVENGKTTYLNEEQVTKVKLKLQGHHNLEGTFEVTTESEMSQMTVRVIEYHTMKSRMLAAENKELKNDIKQLVHDFKKTYTTTEIAKELNLSSAQALNKILEAHHVQFNSNGTWVLYSDYAEKGYTNIKETILESGKIIYDRRWTGAGRQFVISVVSKPRIA